MKISPYAILFLSLPLIAGSCVFTHDPEYKVSTAEKENIQDANTPADTDNQEIEILDDPVKTTRTIRMEELGLEFEYSKTRKVEQSPWMFNGEDLFDLGAYPSSLESDSILSGGSGGCCFNFIAEKIDLSEEDSVIKKDISEAFGDTVIIEFSRANINGKQGFHFYRSASYIQSWLLESYLFPIDHPEYTHLLIDGPAYKMFDVDESRLYTESGLAELVEEVYGGLEGEDLELQSEFETFINSLKFQDLVTTDAIEENLTL